MFLEFFLLLRRVAIPVSLGEWLSFLQALDQGLHHSSLTHFYRLCKACCIKHEKHFDHFDQCFAYYFRGTQKLDMPTLKKDFESWLQSAQLPKHLSADERSKLGSWSRQRLLRELENRIKEQKERHDGGSKWVGTGGTSPFGHSGYNPQGIRVGGESGHRRAVHVAADRKFANLSSDLVLATRQMSLALKKLRVLAQVGAADELDIDSTIAATARNAGDIDLVWRKNRENNLKLIMLMDVGGSMTPFAQLSARLFSAASAGMHFKAFDYYYFHNSPYEFLYTDMEREEKIATEDFLQRHSKDCAVIWVGDAAMSPYELFSVGGSVDYYHHNSRPGMEWIDAINAKFAASVWLNPLPRDYWTAQTTHAIAQQITMFPLTIDGLEAAVKCLRKGLS